MKLKYTFESIDMGDEIVAVPVGEGADKVRGMLKLNKEGLEILELLKDDMTEEEILKRLSDKYNNDRDTLITYIRKVTSLLKNADLIEE